MIGFSNDKNYSQWKFLTKWPTFTVDQKNKKYNKHMCHEFNLFLFFKDPAYFETYVKEFLINKLEKTFVDYFLL